MERRGDDGFGSAVRAGAGAGAGAGVGAGAAVGVEGDANGVG